MAATARNDGHVLKFTTDGKFVKQFGFMYANAGSTDTWAFKQVAKIFLDEPANEAYIADGYGNHRVAVIDMETGKIKRIWGAYGKPPTDENLGRYNPTAPVAQQFRNPVHCAEVSKDGFVYVCDRPNDRLQIFTKDGKFVKEVFIAKNTLGDGAVWEVEFSKDPAQKYLYVNDGANEKIYIFDRASMEMLTHVRRRRPPAGPVLRRAQHRDRLEGQPLHDRNLRGQAPPEVRVQGPRAGDQARTRAPSGRRRARSRLAQELRAQALRTSREPCLTLRSDV